MFVPFRELLSLLLRAAADAASMPSVLLPPLPQPSTGATLCGLPNLPVVACSSTSIARLFTTVGEKSRADRAPAASDWVLFARGDCDREREDFEGELDLTRLECDLVDLVSERKGAQRGALGLLLSCLRLSGTVLLLGELLLCVVAV